MEWHMIGVTAAICCPEIDPRSIRAGWDRTTPASARFECKQPDGTPSDYVHCEGSGTLGSA